MEWISVKSKRKPKHGKRVLVIQDPKTTATKEALFAVYNKTTKRYMPPERFDGPIDKEGLQCLGWSDIIYWTSLPTTIVEKI